MLNLIMTHSPRLAAMATNKRLGEDAVTDHAWKHRLAWMRNEHRGATANSVLAAEGALRERTA